MANYSLHDIYDLTKEGDKKEIRNFKYLGEVWNFQILDNREVVCWKLNSADEAEKTFKIEDDMGVMDFEDEVVDWMRNYTNL